MASLRIQKVEFVFISLLSVSRRKEQPKINVIHSVCMIIMSTERSRGHERSGYVFM